MRPHGNAQISAHAPRALGICDRCGSMYNHDELQWQWDWKQGPRLFNLRILVCRSCLDVPQESGRTIVLPPDPVPIANPRPENYVLADNPLSPLNFNPARYFLPLTPQTGNIGNMTLNAGVDAAFDGNFNKRAEMCAALAVSNSSFQNTVGKNWAADNSGTLLTLPSTVPALTHVVASFSIYAPNDRRFLNSATGVTDFHFNGSSNGTTWTTLSSGTTVGTVGEVVTATTSATTSYQFHQIALQGDGISAVALAPPVINVSDAAPNDI
jgi:hypothetical protein